MPKQPGILYSLSKMTEMLFVYAFFFEYGDEVFVKVGQSAKPHRRLGEVANGCPFPLSQAVYTQIGSASIAKSFELRMKVALARFRTRGEWYVFNKAQGGEFSVAANIVYMKVSARKLAWSEVDLQAYTEEQAAASRKWQNRRHKRDA